MPQKDPWKVYHTNVGKCASLMECLAMRLICANKLSMAHVVLGPKALQAIKSRGLPFWSDAVAQGDHQVKHKTGTIITHRLQIPERILSAQLKGRSQLSSVLKNII